MLMEYIANAKPVNPLVCQQIICNSETDINYLNGETSVLHMVAELKPAAEWKLWNYLLKQGANVNQLNGYGENVLQLYLKTQGRGSHVNSEIVRAILRAGFDLSLLTADYKADIASEIGQCGL